MLKHILGILLLVMCSAPLQLVLAASDANDAAGGKDPALFSRMPGFYISSYTTLDFDRFEFPIGSGQTQPVEGAHYSINYSANNGIKLPSGLQITRNYVNAITALGGMLVYEWEDGGYQYVTVKVVKDNIEIWAVVNGAANGMYSVNIIEKKLMNQDVVANAESLTTSIKETGKVVVYGIYFDTDKDEIKPQSEPALAEIVKMLNANAALKLYVVGHTDNVGAFDHNIKLSQNRATAVAKVLVEKYGIAATRLTPYGNGPTSPVASNKNEDGRAKNRRVELVNQ
jgi:OmpA-OmpF porin, OOP family